MDFEHDHLRILLTVQTERRRQAFICPVRVAKRLPGVIPDHDYLVTGIYTENNEPRHFTISPTPGTKQFLRRIPARVAIVRHAITPI